MSANPVIRRLCDEYGRLWGIERCWEVDVKGVGEMHLLPTPASWPDVVLTILGGDANQTELIWLGGTLIGAVGLSWMLRRRKR